MDVAALAEWAGSITGLACVWLAARNHILNWPVSILSTLLYCWVFYQAHLFSDSILQVIFIGFQAYGWYSWKSKNGSASAPIKRMHTFGMVGTLGFVVVFAALWFQFILKLFPNASYPFWDSLTTVISFTAIFLQAKKYIFSWWLWLAADIIYIPLYMNKNLFPTAALYALFLALAVFGGMQWVKIWKQEQATIN